MKPTMLEVIPANGLSFDDGMHLVLDLRRTDLASLPGLSGGRLAVGGLARSGRRRADGRGAVARQGAG